MMCCSIAILLLAAATQANAIASALHATGELPEEVVDKLLDRTLEARPNRRKVLEGTTLGKGGLASSGGTPFARRPQGPSSARWSSRPSGRNIIRRTGNIDYGGFGGGGGWPPTTPPPIDVGPTTTTPTLFPKHFAMLGGALQAGAFALFAGKQVTVIVAPGEVGVVTTFGSVSPNTLPSGLHLKNPVSQVRNVSVKTRLTEEDTRVPTKEGLTVELETALLYHLNPANVTSLFVNVGENYEDIIIKPEMRSIIRELTSEAEAKALYTSGRSEIQRKLKEELSARLGRRGIIVEDVLLKSIRLPQQLVKAIEMKAQSEQEAQRMEFVLQKERQEAARKKIEAEGVAEYQKIIQKGLSANLLKYKGIEATQKLAESPNAKVVVMGNQKDSLPVLFNGGA
jgi:regulator of protease activity HflC (stomatin/prohibitin superfamily)